MTTKSGTNQLHGSAYDYFRAENLNANTFQRNYLGQRKGDFKRHQLGFTVGGPVVLPKLYNGKDKSFFFFSAQWLKEPSTPYLSPLGGLTAAELTGDFSNSKVLASRRPIQDCRYQDRRPLVPRGDALYHGLQVRIRARTPHFRLMGWYTLSYDRDNVDAFREAGLGPSHPGPLIDADWGPAVHARTHKVQMIPSWDLPFFRTQQNWMTSVFGGWNVTMVAEFQSGAHLDVGARNNTFQCQSCYMRADAVAGQELVFDDWKKRPGLSYVNPAAFSPSRQSVRQFHQEHGSVAHAEEPRHDAVEGLPDQGRTQIRASGRVLQPVQLVKLELYPVRASGSVSGHYEHDLLLYSAGSNDPG